MSERSAILRKPWREHILDAHALYLFFRSGRRRCPRFNNDFFTLVFGFAFDFALDFGRAAGESAERACFLGRPTDPSVAAASIAGRFARRPATIAPGTSSLAAEDSRWRRERNASRSRRAAAFVFRSGPCRKF